MISVQKGNPHLPNWFNPSISVVHALVLSRITVTRLVRLAVTVAGFRGVPTSQPQHNPGDVQREA